MSPSVNWQIALRSFCSGQTVIGYGLWIFGARVEDVLYGRIKHRMSYYQDPAAELLRNCARQSIASNLVRRHISTHFSPLVDNLVSEHTSLPVVLDQVIKNPFE